MIELTGGIIFILCIAAVIIVFLLVALIESIVINILKVKQERIKMEGARILVEEHKLQLQRDELNFRMAKEVQGETIEKYNKGKE